MAKFNLKTLNLDDGFHLITAVAKASGCKESNPSKGIYYLVGENAEYRYVSLGDSIAVGHSIDGKWANDYGYHTQYGENGNTYTKIVPNSYTDLIKNNLKNQFVQGEVSAISYAHSGDMVKDLIQKLDQTIVINSIKNANLVTICIGANDILQPALSELGNYINYGTPALGVISQTVQTKIDILNDDANANSYTALLKKLYSINPNANYVFTTIYNPLKYLWLDESTISKDYKDGFFGPLMWAIPDGPLANIGRYALYNADIVQAIFDRVNGPSRDGSDGLSAWTETYITKLNQVLKNKISAFGKSNFIIADTKALYDTFPDRDRPKDAPYHYNDIVNVEFTRGYVVEDMDWGQFWDNIDSLDVNDIMTSVMTNVVNNVIVPDVDPHPETYGHYALYRSFADALGWESLTRYNITYKTSAGGTGTMEKQELITIDNLTAYTNIKDSTFVSTGGEGNHCIGWNTQEDGGGTAYPINGLIGITSNITLYAQWNNMYTLTLTCVPGPDTITSSSTDTGDMGYRGCYVDGNLILSNKTFGQFASNPDKKSYPYGTKVGVVVRTVSNTSGGVKPVITINNGSDLSYQIDPTYMKDAYGYEFTLTKDTLIEFVWRDWRIATLDFTGDAYWDCYITTY